MSCTVKCITCNIVIDELLCYIQNKVSICDEESLVKICTSTYTTEQIQKSHTLLFESVSSTEHRKIARKGKKKEDRCLYDILNFFKVTDPDSLPVFVARELEKLPPITFDHLDVSKLLKDLVLVQEDIKNIKASYATAEQLESVRKECLNVRIRSSPFSAVKINMKRGAYMDSGPIGLSHFDESTRSEQENQSNCDISNSNSQNIQFRSLINNHSEGSGDPLAETTVHPTVCGAHIASVTDNKCDESVLISTRQPAAQLIDIDSGRGNRGNNDSFAAVVKSDKEWTVVQRKGKKAKNRIEGKKGTVVVETDEMFRAAERRVPLFITNVHKNTSESDIARYICKMTQETVKLKKIFIRRECDYNAYKFFVAQNKLALFLDEKIWPRGIIFRRFFNFKIKRENTVNKDGLSVSKNA